MQDVEHETEDVWPEIEDWQQHLLGTAKRFLGVDNPCLGIQFVDDLAELFRKKRDFFLLQQGGQACKIDPGRKALKRYQGCNS